VKKKKEYYGRALVLGGCGITLKELAELFSALANGGVYRKSKYLKNSSGGDPVRILSPQAAYLTGRILLDASRVSYGSTWEFIRDIPAVAFKTGTSAHSKDLLCVGYTREYTVAVWIGNFDRSASQKRDSGSKKGRRLSGLEAASPLMFSIFRALASSGIPEAPAGITKRRICQDAIQIGKCERYIEDDTIDGVSLHTPCTILRPEIMTKMLESGRIKSFSDLAVHRCYGEWSSYKPRIGSPVKGKEYVMNRYLPPSLKKIGLKCHSFDDNGTIYWMVDDNGSFRVLSGETLYMHFSPGGHTVRCLDRSSRMDSATFFVREL